MKLSLALFALAGAFPVVAQPATGFEAHPEFSPSRLVPPIVAAIQEELVDAQSVRNLVVCPPVKIRYSGEPRRPVGWTVMISLQARNAEGGYTGNQVYGAIFREGKRVKLAAAMMASNDGLDGIVNRAIKAQMANCPIVPQDKLEQMLQQPGRPVLDL